MRILYVVTTALLISGLPNAAAQAQVPELRLTSPDATFPQEFGFVRGVRELPDGRVLVADGPGQVLALVDFTAGTADTIGREGRGPGEYLQPDGLWSMPGDSTLLVDLGNGRLSMIGPDLAFGRTARIAEGDPMTGQLSIRLPRGTDSSGRLYYEAMGRMRPDGSLRDSAAVLRWDPVREVDDTVAMVTLDELVVQRSGGPDNESVDMRQKPMSPRDGWAVSVDGWIGVVRASDYHVEWYGSMGPVVVGTAVGYDPVKVRDPEKEAYLEEMGRGGLMISVEAENGQMRTNFRRGPGRRGGPTADGLEWPDVMPPFQSSGVFATPWGELWVQRSVAADVDLTFDVFDRSAGLLKQVILPKGRRVIGFGDDTVYVVRMDEFDLNWLERYRVAP